LLLPPYFLLVATERSFLLRFGAALLIDCCLLLEGSIVINACPART
jgi:hypothetical protein